MGVKFKPVVFFLALAVAVAAFAVPSAAYAEMEYRFSDKDTIETDFAWGKNDIIEAIDFELYYGYPDGTLRLGNDITRAEFAAVLARCIDVSGEPGPNWYDAVVDGLVKAGIIPDKSGDWDAPITRLEAAKWLGRLAKVYNVPVREPGAGFTDTGDPDAAYAGKTGLVKGIGGGLLGVDRNLTRAEAAVLLIRVAKSVDTDLSSDEELLQAVREVNEDVNANIEYLVKTGKADPSAYDTILPYKRMTGNYFEYAQKAALYAAQMGYKANKVDMREVKVVEKHRAIAYVVGRPYLYSGNEGFYGAPVVSRFRRIEGRWMMTEGAAELSDITMKEDLKYIAKWRAMK